MDALTSLLAKTLSNVSSVGARRWMLDAFFYSSRPKLFIRAPLPCSSHRLQSRSNKAFPLPRCRWLSCFLYGRRPGTSHPWETRTLSHLGTAWRTRSSGEPELTAESIGQQAQPSITPLPASLPLPCQHPPSQGQEARTRFGAPRPEPACDRGRVKPQLTGSTPQT